jgi:hypothetical protein
LQQASSFPRKRSERFLHVTAFTPKFTIRAPLHEELPVIHPNTVIRIARPTDRLDVITTQYMKGLGFQLLSTFEDHKGFDGVILGHPQHPYHLEFTHHRGTQVGYAPTQDNLLVFYVPGHEAWRSACAAMVAAGFTEVASYNPYWDERGKTFEDADRYRIVIECDAWMK